MGHIQKKRYEFTVDAGARERRLGGHVGEVRQRAVDHARLGQSAEISPRSRRDRAGDGRPRRLDLLTTYSRLTFVVSTTAACASSTHSSARQKMSSTHDWESIDNNNHNIIIMTGKGE